MMKQALAALLALTFASLALACSCLPPPALGECDVDEASAFVYAKVLSVTQPECGGVQGDVIKVNNGAIISEVRPPAHGSGT